MSYMSNMSNCSTGFAFKIMVPKRDSSTKTCHFPTSPPFLLACFFPRFFKVDNHQHRHVFCPNVSPTSPQLPKHLPWGMWPMDHGWVIGWNGPGWTYSGPCLVPSAPSRRCGSFVGRYACCGRAAAAVTVVLFELEGRKNHPVHR